MIWVDFRSDPDREHLKPYANETHFLEIADQEPKLLLNKSFDGLPELFQERPRPRGVQLALLETVRTSIAKAVWLALWHSALSEIRPQEDTDEVEWPLTPWRADVLKTILRHMQGFEDMDPEAALREVHLAYASGAVNGVESRALAAIMKNIVKEGQSLRTALRSAATASEFGPMEEPTHG